MIIVTGGAGFIGSNFVRLWLGLESKFIVVADKFTYAANLENRRFRERSPTIIERMA